MRKTYIRTEDIFSKDAVKYFNACYQTALKCKLICMVKATRNSGITLCMSGAKKSFIKYYILTLLKTEKKTGGVKRLFSIICT